MPLVDIQLIKGVFWPDQKKLMIQKVTDAVVSVEKAPSCAALPAWKSAVGRHSIPRRLAMADVPMSYRSPTRLRNR
jgi:hypothetical protein